MGISISFNTIGEKDKSKLIGADKHNERKYTNKSLDNTNSSINFDLSKYNQLLIGTDNLYEDVKKVYKREFREAVDEYNKNQKRSDRKIYDYFEKIASNKKTNLYTEIIVQVGDENIWKDKSLEEKQKMVSVFKKQIEIINRFYPNFKICNAIIHFDETSPHMHIIGVGVSNKELALQNKDDKKDRKRQNGLKTYVAQTEVFTSKNMIEFHKEFSEKSLEIYNKIYQTNEILNDKKLHQQHLDLETYKRVAPIINARQKEYDKLKEDIEDLEKNKVKIKDLIEKERKKYITISDIKKNVVEKKGLLNREIKITLDQKDYNTLLAYAIEGEEKNKELEKYKEMYSDLKEAVTNYTTNVKANQEQEQNEKKKLMTEKDEILKKLERVLSKNDSLNFKLENEKVKNKNFIENKIELEEKIKNLENDNNNLLESIEELITCVEKSNQEMSNFLNEKFKKDWKEKTLYSDILESENKITDIIFEPENNSNNIPEVSSVQYNHNQEIKNEELDEKEKQEQLLLEKIILLSKIEIYEKEILDKLNEEEKILLADKIYKLNDLKENINLALEGEIEYKLGIKFFSNLIKNRNDLVEKNKNYSNLRNELSDSSKKSRKYRELTTAIVNNNRKIKVINIVLAKINSKIKTQNNEKVENIKSLNFKFLNKNCNTTNNSLKLKVSNTGRITIDDDIEDNDDNIISNSPRAKRTRSTRSRSR